MKNHGDFMNQKVLVGMSGGVDSSVAVFLLKEMGYEPVGITLKLYSENSRCCNLDDVQDAKLVASRMNIPHYVLDIQKEFEEKVIRYFVDSYLEGKTPNPCPFCNDRMKIKVLIEKADELGIPYVATGHYAKIVATPNGKRLSRAKDRKKSQEYFLSLLSPEYLERLILPLSGYNKEEIREIADKNSLEVVSRKKDSQEVCFIPDGNYFDFIQKFESDLPGEGAIVTSGGDEVGTHPGFYKFTIGQRRGIGVGLGKPQYVVELDAENNRVIIGDKEEIRKKRIEISLQRIYDNLHENTVYPVKIRYKSPAQNAKIIEISGKNVILEAEDVFSAPTPGQLSVFYDNQGLVLAAGEIVKSF
jgi:tRNA-specific 2-thiouridylase